MVVNCGARGVQSLMAISGKMGSMQSRTVHMGPVTLLATIVAILASLATNTSPPVPQILGIDIFGIDMYLQIVVKVMMIVAMTVVMIIVMIMIIIMAMMIMIMMIT